MAAGLGGFRITNPVANGPVVTDVQHSRDEAVRAAEPILGDRPGPLFLGIRCHSRQCCPRARTDCSPLGPRRPAVAVTPVGTVSTLLVTELAQHKLRTGRNGDDLVFGAT